MKYVCIFHMCPVADIFTSWRDSPGACRPASDNDSKREEFYFGQVICDAHHLVNLFLSILVLPGRTTHCQISLVPNPAPHSFIVNIRSVLIGCGCHCRIDKSSFWFRTSPVSLSFLFLLHFPAEVFIGFSLLVLLQFSHVALFISVRFIQIPLRQNESDVRCLWKAFNLD